MVLAETERRGRVSPGGDDDAAAETELTLGLPGGKASAKRGFSETVDLNQRSRGSADAGETVADAGKPAAPK